MFIDRAKIRVQGGRGGNGVTAFRREKFVPRGGPSGGDGGRGGDVWFVADESLNTLLHLRYNPEHIAERGRHGEGSNCSGREGEDLIVVTVGPNLDRNREFLQDLGDAPWWRKAGGEALAIPTLPRRLIALRAITRVAARAKSANCNWS